MIRKRFFLYYFLTPTVRSETCAIFWPLRQSRKSIIRVFTVCCLTYFERESTVAVIIVLLIIFALIGFVRTRFAKHPLSYHSGYETRFTVVCVVSVDLASLLCRSFKTAFQTKHNNNNSMNINWENNEAWLPKSTNETIKRRFANRSLRYSTNFFLMYCSNHCRIFRLLRGQIRRTHFVNTFFNLFHNLWTVIPYDNRWIIHENRFRQIHFFFKITLWYSEYKYKMIFDD